MCSYFFKILKNCRELGCFYSLDHIHQGIEEKQEAPKEKEIMESSP